MSDTKAAQVSKKKIQWGFELPSLSLKNFSQEMPLTGVNVEFLILTLRCLSICLGEDHSVGIIPLYFLKIMPEKEHFIHSAKCLAWRLDRENT